MASQRPKRLLRMGRSFRIGISAGDSGVNRMSIIDAANDQVNPTPIQLPGIPFSVVFTPDGTYAYVSYNANGVYSLALIDTASQTVVNSNVAGSSLHANTCRAGAIDDGPKRERTLR